MTRVAAAACLAVLTAALLTVAHLGEQPAPPAAPAPTWQEPRPARVTAPPGVTWCPNEDACDGMR